MSVFLCMPDGTLICASRDSLKIRQVSVFPKTLRDSAAGISGTSIQFCYDQTSNWRQASQRASVPRAGHSSKTPYSHGAKLKHANT
jgi:hypothetical protein